MEERIELKDPEHPEAKAAAEATARLLIEVHRKRQELSQMKVAPESASDCDNRTAQVVEA